MHGIYSQDNTTISMLSPVRRTSIPYHAVRRREVPGEISDTACSSWSFTNRSPTCTPVDQSAGHPPRMLNAVYSAQDPSRASRTEEPCFGAGVLENYNLSDEYCPTASEDIKTEPWSEEMHSPVGQDTQAASSDPSANQLCNKLSFALSTPPNNALECKDAGGYEPEVWENTPRYPYDTDLFDEQFDDATLMSIHDHFSLQVSPTLVQSVPSDSGTSATSKRLEGQSASSVSFSPIQFPGTIKREGTNKPSENISPGILEDGGKTKSLMALNGEFQGVKAPNASDKALLPEADAASNTPYGARGKVQEEVLCSPQPFVRPSFPGPVLVRSPIQGLTSTHTLLRTCFRIGEALKASLSQARNRIPPPLPAGSLSTGDPENQPPSPLSPSVPQSPPASTTTLTELYAFVERSYRSNHIQYFRFVDLFFPSRPPYLSGLWRGWNDNPVFNDDGRAFLGRGGREWTWDGAGSASIGQKRKRDDSNCFSKGFGDGRKMCRAVGVIEKGEKKCMIDGNPIEGPIMTVLSIWEAQWSDVEYVKGIVEA